MDSLDTLKLYHVEFEFTIQKDEYHPAGTRKTNDKYRLEEYLVAGSEADARESLRVQWDSSRKSLFSQILKKHFIIHDIFGPEIKSVKEVKVYGCNIVIQRRTQSIPNELERKVGEVAQEQ